MQNSAMDSTNKEQYRKIVWNLVDSWMRKPRALRRVIYLDTALGLETAFLLRRGYQSQNLLPVNFSAAELAHLNRKFPDVHGKSGNLLEMDRSFADIIHFDATTHVQALACKDLSIYDSVNSQIIIANIIGGRETYLPSKEEHLKMSRDYRTPGAVCEAEMTFAYLKSQSKRFTDSDLLRLRQLSGLMIPDHRVFDLDQFRVGKYLGGTNNRFPMIWCAMKVIKKRKEISKFGIKGDPSVMRKAKASLIV